jgi:hypothetical protein
MLLKLNLAVYTERIEKRGMQRKTAMSRQKESPPKLLGGVSIEIRSSLASVASVRTRVSAARAAVIATGTRMRSAAAVIAAK